MNGICGPWGDRIGPRRPGSEEPWDCSGNGGRLFLFRRGLFTGFVHILGASSAMAGISTDN